MAKVVLLLKDDNGTTIADSVSCVYDTRFDTSLMTFRGEISSQNLLYGGSLQEDGNDVETTVYSSEAIAMDFFDQVWTIFVFILTSSVLISTDGKAAVAGALIDWL